MAGTAPTGRAHKLVGNPVVAAAHLRVWERVCRHGQLLDTAPCGVAVVVDIGDENAVVALPAVWVVRISFDATIVLVKPVVFVGSSKLILLLFYLIYRGEKKWNEI